MNPNNIQEKQKKEVKFLVDYFPYPPERMSIERIKSYTQLEHVSDEQAQELIYFLETICHIRIEKNWEIAP